MKFDTELTKAEIERLALLSEECAEVIHVIGKILRHGYYSFNPVVEDETPITNKKLLMKEISHINVAIKLMLDEDDIFETTIAHYRVQKLEKINQYLHFNEVTP